MEVVDSTHEGTKWLFVYGVHICHKQIECPAEVKWRCSLKIVQTGDGSSALLSSQLGDKMEKICIYLHFVYKFGESPMVIVMLNVDD